MGARSDARTKLRIDDPVQVTLGAVGQRVDLGTGILLPVRHVVERLCELAGTSVQPQFGGMPDRPGETEAVADPEQTRRLCGWIASTDLDTGLARTLAWYQ
jgi:UDP-glucose 4-epimerase